MREILFRGKRIDNGKWVEGFYHFTNWYKPKTLELVETAYAILPIAAQDSFEVDPLTVGQFAGLTDKNGKKIFEGDKCIDSRGFRFTVEWDVENARFLGRGGGYIRYIGQEPAVTVIGNIHDKGDNP